MRINSTQYLAAYKSAINYDLEERFNSIDFSESKIDLSYRIQASAVFSSNIEGNTIDLNSYMNSKLSKQQFKPQTQLKEIEDLVSAYEFAKGNELNEKNLLEAHRILSQEILIKDKQGTYRNDRMGVFGDIGLVYLAIEPQFVEEKMEELFVDIQVLISSKLDLYELFYHAALIHLKFVHIHPFWDGNGRAARLLEKWFLSSKMDSRAWKIQSERYYKEHLSNYYNSISLGVNYYELNYDKCLPFLMLLPKALEQDK